MDITNGRGVDCVVEVGGAGTIARSFASIRVGGKVSLIGNLSGPPTELNPGLILAKRANVQGISVEFFITRRSYNHLYTHSFRQLQAEN
jgi:NADPH:quinone reductase-like Zn-dependent oxidoreductase